MIMINKYNSGDINKTRVVYRRCISKRLTPHLSAPINQILPLSDDVILHVVVRILGGCGITLLFSKFKSVVR